MTARCEPPEEWRENGRAHFLAKGAGVAILLWRLGAWWDFGLETDDSPEFLAANGWRYIAPVLTPAEVAEREAAAYQRGQQEMRERAIGSCREQKTIFLSPEYATGQPISSLSERFACGQCEALIAALPIKDKPE